MIELTCPYHCPITIGGQVTLEHHHLLRSVSVTRSKGRESVIVTDKTLKGNKKECWGLTFIQFANYAMKSSGYRLIKIIAE